MSTFLFTLLSSNDLGVITRALPVARLLKQNGHTVIFSVYNKVPLMLVEEEGFENVKLTTSWDELAIKIKRQNGFWNYIKYNPLNEVITEIKKVLSESVGVLPNIFIKSTPEIYNAEHFFSLHGMRSESYIVQTVESFMRIMKEVEADFIIDFWNPFSSIAAKVLGIPLITINQFDVHPASNGFIWWKDNNKPKFKSILPVVNKVLTKYNLNTVLKFEELTVGDLTLTLGMPNKKDIQQDYGINHIGFLPYRKKNATLPDEILNIKNDKPIVWVYSGNPRYAGLKTDFDSEVLLDICINILSEENLNIVLTTGYHSIPEKYYPLPDNIFFTEFIDGLSMARKADVIIHHGGYGSCQTALISGTPSVIIPTFSERESNARRITNLGVAEFVLPKRKRFSKKKVIDPNEFLQKFRKVLNNKSYAENAKEISGNLEKFNSKNRAIKMILKFVALVSSRNQILPEKKLEFFSAYSKNLKLINRWNDKVKLIS